MSNRAKEIYNILRDAEGELTLSTGLFGGLVKVTRDHAYDGVPYRVITDGMSIHVHTLEGVANCIDMIY